MAFSNPHTINWFEIPVSDIERAKKFYETVLEVKLELSDFGNWKLAVFPGGEDKNSAVVHGALIQGDTYEPSEKGALVYFNGGEDLNRHLSKVKDAGGEILKEKFSIGEHGHIAIFKDSEGNRVALHSVN